MAERDTVTGPGPEPDPSALAWVGKWLQSDRAARGPASGEPVTRSLNGSASTGVNATDLAVSPVLFGHYELLEKIGQGGMGSVYRVRNLELDRHEALKLIAPRNSDDSAARTRFEREFLSLAKIEHPHIVPVYAAGAWEGVPYFTMKYVPGGALSKHLDRFRMDPAATARLMAKVARAVQKLHHAGVLHRDLKPHNILLGDGDEPLVADFGLVKKLGEDSDASVTGAPMGTRQYMSPEQTFAQKADYTPACDVWAIGVILYELLAGERPFPSTDPVEVYMQIRAANPVPILEINPAAPGPLAAVAHRCIAKPPADRYPTAAAVADDLEAWLAGDAVTATLPPPPRPARRRWPRWVAGGGATAAVVAAGLAATPPAAQTVTEATARIAVAPPRIAVAPPPRLAPTIAERLARGETVVLVGETGGPRFPSRIAPETATDATLSPDGLLALNAVTFAAVELCDEPLPAGTAIEGEVAVGQGLDVESMAGLYAGGRSWPAADGSRRANVVALMRYELLSRPNADGERFPIERRGFELFPYANGRQEIRGSLPTLELPPSPPAETDGRVWHRVRIDIHPDRLFGTWNSLPVPPAGEGLVTSFLRPNQPTVTPTLGNKIGLAVNRAGAVFRNVRLVPHTP